VRSVWRAVAAVAAAALVSCAHDERYFFAGVDADHGIEPWTSDGTAEGTRLLKDVQAGRSSSGVALFTRGSGGTYFTTVLPGRQLWRSDGTEAGTVLVKNFGPRPAGTPAERADVCDLAAIGHRLFFTVDDFVHGRELWVTEGTEETTHLVADLAPGPTSSWASTCSTGSSLTSGISSLRGQALFGVWQGSETALFRSDSTEAGTVEVFRYSDHLFLQGVGSRVLFAGTHDLFATDGTEGGTVLLHAFNRGRDVEYRRIVAAGGRLFLAASDETSLANTTGSQLWKSDGTAAGTVRVKDLDDQLIWLSTLTAAGSDVYFMASPRPAGHPQNPKALWKSDGTERGTAPVAPVALGNVSNMTGGHGRLFFDIWYGTGVGNAPGIASQLWTSDGTRNGTHNLRTFYTARGHQLIGGTLFFMADERPGTLDLWKSDGTAAGTVVVRAF